MALKNHDVSISIIIPIYNGADWVDECFKSICDQDVFGRCPLQVCVHDDCSTDGTSSKLLEWQRVLTTLNISMTITRGNTLKPQGVGYSKNQAVQRSNGTFLCFQDVDDVMHRSRLSQQLDAAEKHCEAIVGCQFVRKPENSTVRFTRWANNLPQNLLPVQVFTSHGPTVIMPTWFCSRQVYDRVGGFSEDGAGVPEDLIFFYRHLDLGGTVIRVDQVLLTYRYHMNAATFSISETTMWNLRLKRLEEKYLSKWNSFTIWNAGKQGRRFWHSLPVFLRKKVVCLCDVDEKKIGRFYEPYLRNSPERVKIPILHFRKCSPPFVICVKMDLTQGLFEQNLSSLNLVEDIDYVMFS